MPRLAARPGADLSAVRLRVEGADAVAVEGDALRLSTAAGEADLAAAARRRVDCRGSCAAARRAGVRGDRALRRRRHLAHHAAGSSADDNPADLLYGTFLGGS